MADTLEKEDVKQGSGAEAVAGKRVTVHYVGTLTDGSKFDSSRDRGKGFSFRLGGGQVIKGWDQGLVGVTVGSRVQLDIPAELGSPSLGGPLRFVVDVLAAK